MSSPLPIHFFTIVLNGEPFIRRHIDVFSQLTFPWHWHIIEGVAELKHDTAWSLANGGKISADFHQEGRSVDGTSKYLDDLQKEFPNQITIYRKPKGIFWDGKLEMVNAPISNLHSRCLLWQVDVDEFWTLEQIVACRELFLEFPERKAAFFWCEFFVGPELVIENRETYGNNPQVEWLRTWRFEPGDRWIRHEPPLLAGRWEQFRAAIRKILFRKGPKFNASRLNAFSHEMTESRGLVFRHLAYVISEQVAFKELYYGYAGAQQRWHNLQNETAFPVKLKHYFEWVKDETLVKKASARVQIAWPETGA